MKTFYYIYFDCVDSSILLGDAYFCLVIIQKPLLICLTSWERFSIHGSQCGCRKDSMASKVANNFGCGYRDLSYIKQLEYGSHFWVLLVISAPCHACICMYYCMRGCTRNQSLVLPTHQKAPVLIFGPNLIID